MKWRSEKKSTSTLAQEIALDGKGRDCNIWVKRVG